MGMTTLKLMFSNSAVNFTPLMKKSFCYKLQDKDYFSNFKLDPFTVGLNSEIGFAPEVLYERGKKDFPNAPFK